MNTAYNTNTATVQDARNRYNALLAQALERIKTRKTDKTAQPEEVTTTATDVTTTATPTQQPEPVATPEEVTTTRKTTKTRRTKTETPKALGSKIYKLYPRVDGAKTRNGVMCQDIIYHDPAGYAVVTDNKTVTASKLDYQEEYKGKAITASGDEHPFVEALKTYRTLLPVADKVYTIDLDSLKESVQACNVRGEYYIVLKYPDGTMQVTHTASLLNALQIASKLQVTKLTSDDTKIQLSSDYGLVLMACPRFSNREEDYHDGTEPHDPALDIKTIIDLTDVITATEDTIPDKPETTQTDKPETTVQEPEEETTEEETTATDDAILLRDLMEQYGNVGADYLDTLDYTQATEQEPRKEMFIRAEVTKKEYTTDKTDLAGNPQTFGLSRCHNRNGKRAIFTVYKDGLAIELRWYGKNNNTYKGYIRYKGGILRYEVEEGKVTRAERETIWDNKISVEFDDDNRPETPRDLPAPAPSKATSKETAKEEPATTEEEQPTSKTATAPTTEEVTAPEEVQAVTTSKQEDDPAPYWLLLDNELKAQQEEQETVPATPEKSEEEPMHAPQMLKKIIEEQKRRAAEGTNTIPLKTAVGMTTEVLTPKRAKELRGDCDTDLNTYVLVGGTHVVRFDRPELSNTLYIDDESPEYKEYSRGNISAVELWRNDAMRLHNPARDLDTIKRIPNCLRVLRGKDNVLEYSKYGKARYGYRLANPDEVEIYKAAAAAASEAFTKRLDSYLKRYGSKIYVHSYWADR